MAWMLRSGWIPREYHTQSHMGQASSAVFQNFETKSNRLFEIRKMRMKNDKSMSTFSDKHFIANDLLSQNFMTGKHVFNAILSNVSLRRV